MTICDTHDRLLSQDELSAGERQIYTTSILWALAENFWQGTANDS